MPKVTVCVSVYNGADTLGPTLDSVASQTFKDFELLVLDDGSTDGSAEVAESKGARVVRQRNMGRGAALARLMELAETEWVALLDADDLWTPEKLERQMARAADGGVDLIHSGGWFDYPDGRSELHEKLAFPPRNSWDHILPNNQIIASSALFKREAILEAGNFSADTWSACDWYGWLVMAPECKFDYIPKPLVRYKIRPGSIANRGYRFQEGKRHVLKDLILPRADTLFAKLSDTQAQHYRAMITRGIGVAASTMAKFLTEEGKIEEARELHKEALKLAPGVPRVWTRAIRSVGRRRR